MNKYEKEQEINRIINDINADKSNLFRRMSDLEDVGAIREANALSTIIGRLEGWQHKYSR